MSEFNVCIIQPPDYPHSLAFLELADLLCYSLRDLGFQASSSFNRVEPGARNILIGCHLLDPSFIQALPRSTIVLNTEQIVDDNPIWSKVMLQWTQNFETWDYSEKNISKFKTLGIENIKWLNIGFQKELVRIPAVRIQDIDVLFYGSLNTRRNVILDRLIEKGLTVRTLFGVYGQERDAFIARSKVILNHHYYESQIFEIVRVFYLLTNSKAVVGEVNEKTQISNMCKQGIYNARYDEIVDRCRELVANKGLREAIQERAYASISRYPQTTFMRDVLA
jgi:hypothetical protein